MSERLVYNNISQLSSKLENGEITSSEICSEYLDRIDKIENKVNAFLSIDRDDILKQAEETDTRRKNNSPVSKFDGIPISIKDIINVKGQPCTCGSKILEPYNSVYDATVITKLKKKGFITFGRNNMDEFAMGSSCESSAYKKTSNPWDLERVPGGSSGGSAAAVSAGEIVASLGTDTGGSVRQPAAFCGVVGLKPTYGRVSRSGVVAYASSLDQVGPITRNVSDSAILLDAISGFDKMDSTSINESMDESYENIIARCNNDLAGFKVGVPTEYLHLDGLSNSVKSNYLETIETLKELGAEIVEVSFPYTKYGIAAYYVIATAEASANLARFDGVRYGKRCKNYKDLNELYFKTRGQNFGDEVARRILLGTFVLSSGYYDAYYLKAQKARTLIMNDFVNTFKGCDVVLSPTSPTSAFKIGGISDPVEMYLADVFTIFANLAGICAMSVPSGLDENNGLPLGIQFIGPHLGENKILKVAKVFENNRAIKEFIPNI
jgi:aspartyl-tRNA(Asn)/glutamyl-tRNA(Gln) amidotransferase subunit A